MPSFAKKIISAVLLLFVAGSLAYLVMTEASTSASNGAEFEPLPENAELIVYYLSEGKDCSTCRYLDEYTREVLETYFADDLAAGQIVWRTADMDQPANQHYLTDYDLYTKSIVLVKIDRGEETAHKNLEKIWDYVYDKPAFLAYIRSEIEGFRDGTS